MLTRRRRPHSRFMAFHRSDSTQSQISDSAPGSVLLTGESVKYTTRCQIWLSHYDQIYAFVASLTFLTITCANNVVEKNRKYKTYRNAARGGPSHATGSMQKKLVKI